MNINKKMFLFSLLILGLIPALTCFGNKVFINNDVNFEETGLKLEYQLGTGKWQLIKNARSQTIELTNKDLKIRCGQSEIVVRPKENDTQINVNPYIRNGFVVWDLETEP
jgi:hypothetical protein